VCVYCIPISRHAFTCVVLNMHAVILKRYCLHHFVCLREREAQSTRRNEPICLDMLLLSHTHRMPFPNRPTLPSRPTERTFPGDRACLGAPHQLNPCTAGTCPPHRTSFAWQAVPRFRDEVVNRAHVGLAKVTGGDKIN
jgi:hypothetical protein